MRSIFRWHGMIDALHMLTSHVCVINIRSPSLWLSFRQTREADIWISMRSKGPLGPPEAILFAKYVILVIIIIWFH